MTQWEKMMVFYGSHHRSRANIVAHILGVPIILTGAMVPLALVEVGLRGCESRSRGSRRSGSRRRTSGSTVSSRSARW
ncbi:MAG: DUF962 domain-containing protein [Deltaproteobacteria bacterium]|nr:DUF962 domain-containing protein [Deltaproteobacteria bacterium]